jgi:dipeptidyl aminopeptidase/acylaminoacyl peptidase
MTERNDQTQFYLFTGIGAVGMAAIAAAVYFLAFSGSSGPDNSVADTTSNPVSPQTTGNDNGSGSTQNVNAATPNAEQTLADARKGFTTKIVKSGSSEGPPDTPTGNTFELIRYESPVGRLAAYVTTDPGDGKKHPAIVWITGGDNNSIGDVWSPNGRDNDQSASAFRKAGVVMMFPSQRGGNDNPGKREGFLGEADDILAATDHLAKLPYVDSEQIYLGGHSTGGTMVMLVAALSDRYRATFALGPVASASEYGGDYLYCDPQDQAEIRLRSPIFWLHSVKSPLYVFEGGRNGNWDVIELMKGRNSNPKIQFFKVDGHDHFSVIAPLAEKLADQIISGKINVTSATVMNLR